MKVQISIFVCILHSILGYPAAQLNLNPLIVGGVEVTKNELPYQVSIRIHPINSHFCGGVILNSLYVLTSAHCANQYSASYLSVVAGEHSLTSDDKTEQLRYVDRIVVHPSYSSSTLENDIALLRLRSQFTLNNAVAPIALATAGSTASGNAIVSGWGRTSEGGSTSTILRKVTVPIITDTLCRASYGTTAIKDSMICAGERGKDSCQGDSGGPLIAGSFNDKVLVGLVSWGTGCGRESYPGVYTEISHFRTWISQNST